MKVINTIKLENNYESYDLTTPTANFFVKMGERYILVHNSPSIVFGKNPENGKFFVASKSAFNKTPKINYTDEDIENNHGHAPGLVDKLKYALKELPKIMPRTGGVYQGDLMYTKHDLKHDSEKSYFKPNTITYAAKKDSAHGRKIAAANLGLVIHTKYVGKKLSDMKANFDVDQNSFKQDPDVHLINPEMSDGKIDPSESAEFEKHIKSATDHYSKMDSSIFDSITGHDVIIKTYINDCVRKDTDPSFKGFTKFVNEKNNKELEKVKSPALKEKKQKEAEELSSHFDKNKKNIEDILKLHKHIQDAKNTLVNSLSKNTEFEHYIGDKPTKPEGFVVTKNGRPTKLVDRAEFSKANFSAGAFQKQQKEDKPLNPVVFSFGRMNPPTVGHGKLIDKVQQEAKLRNATHKIVLSRSHDPEKNPLSPEQKETHARRMFPGANINVASESEPSVIHQLKKLNAAGHDHLTMVVGSDRVDEFKKLTKEYNGKEFNFKNIDIVSAGDRDPDSEGVEGMSASKMRAHAMGNNYKDFNKGLPKSLHPIHGKELFRDVRKGMEIKIDSTTPAISLGRYAKRNDEIGEKARREQERRKITKRMIKESLSIFYK